MSYYGRHGNKDKELQLFSHTAHSDDLEFLVELGLELVGAEAAGLASREHTGDVQRVAFDHNLCVVDLLLVVQDDLLHEARKLLLKNRGDERDSLRSS